MCVPVLIYTWVVLFAFDVFVFMCAVHECTLTVAPLAVVFNDLYSFSPAVGTWTALFPSGSGPSPRSTPGFTVTPDGMVYIFGGWNENGDLLAYVRFVYGLWYVHALRERPVVFMYEYV